MGERQPSHIEEIIDHPNPEDNTPVDKPRRRIEEIIENENKPARIVRLLDQNRELLQSKLVQYEARFDRTKPMGTQMETLYKIDMIKAMLDSGILIEDEIAADIERKYKAIMLDKFRNAFEVIADYATTGGQNTIQASNK